MRTTAAALCIIIGLIVCLIVAPVAHAEFMLPEPAPIDRVLANCDRYLTLHPDDPVGMYALARAHYLAYSLKALAVPVYNRHALVTTDDKNPDDPAVLAAIAPREHIHGTDWYRRSARQARARTMALESLGLKDGERITNHDDFAKAYQAADAKLANDNWQPPAPTQEQLDGHAERALRLFAQVVARNPDHALAQVGLACLQEEYAARAVERDLLPTGQPNTTEQKSQIADWHRAAMTNYDKAYQLALAHDTKAEHLPVAGLESLVSFQAATGYLRLAAAQPALAKPDRASRMKAQLDQYKNLPMGPITPIIFDLRPPRAGGRDRPLWSDRLRVRFDLDGDRTPESRPWVTPGVSLLVWDPMNTGKITSGRQLFGNVTWWLFWDNGFAALASLDDDHDGRLDGPELRGLAVWTDRNANALSEPGEVVPIEHTPIRAIAVRPTLRLQDASRSPANPHGLILNDGSTRPLIDWTLCR